MKMNHLLSPSTIVCSVAISVAANAESSNELPVWKPKAKTLAVFKNGLGFVMKDGKTDLKDGWARTEQLPAAALGALWIGAKGKGDSIAEVVAYKDKVPGEWKDETMKGFVLDGLIENKLWLNTHYEGSYLYRNSIVVELVPPAEKGNKWKVTYAWQGQGSSPANQEIDPKTLRGGKIEISVPFDSATTPGIRGQVRFVVSAWNPDAVMDDAGNPL